MDVLSLLGLLLAFGAVLLGQYFEGGSILSLLNGPALLIVAGGTLGAAMLQSPMPVFSRAMTLLSWVLRPPMLPSEQMLKHLVDWGKVARREGLLGLERVAGTVSDSFAREALGMVVDGNEPEVIRGTLEMSITASEDRDLEAARVLDGMGGYAPTIGILGAVIGLIQVMGNLTEPAQLGSGIAVAFVATVYGVALANLVLLPVANKLKAVVRQRSKYQELITEGVVAIAEGENPRVIEQRLAGLIAN